MLKKPRSCRHDMEICNYTTVKLSELHRGDSHAGQYTEYQCINMAKVFRLFYDTVCG